MKNFVKETGPGEDVRSRLPRILTRTGFLSKPDAQLVAGGILLEFTLLAFWAYSGVWRGSWQLIVGFFLPGIVFLGIAWWVFHLPFTRSTLRTRSIILGFAVLFHLTLLFTPDPLSNDIYRYSWDGKLLASGVNPYSYPPAAEELTSYRDANWELIFNRDVPTGYPPLAEGLFAIAYRLTRDPWMLRLFAMLASLGTAALLMRALRIAGIDERRSLLYAWSPLVALEFSNSAHLDSYALFLMSAALVLALERKPVGSAVCLALGGLVKFYPVVLLPLWGRRWSKKAWLAFFLVFCLPWLPFLRGGTPFTGLGIFASRGDFNNSLYRLIEDLFYQLIHSAVARLWARAAIFASIVILAFVLFARQRKQANLLSDWRLAGVLFGVCLLFSPVIHPWYVIWMLVFGIFSPSPAWLVLSITIIFARHVYIGYEQTGIWEEAWWPSLAVWIPFYAVLILQWIRSGFQIKASRPEPSEGSQVVVRRDPRAAFRFMERR